MLPQRTHGSARSNAEVASAVGDHHLGSVTSEGVGLARRGARTFVQVEVAQLSISTSHKHREAMRRDCPLFSPTDAWQISLKRGIPPPLSAARRE